MREGPSRGAGTRGLSRQLLAGDEVASERARSSTGAFTAWVRELRPTRVEGWGRREAGTEKTATAPGSSSSRSRSSSRSSSRSTQQQQQRGEGRHLPPKRATTVRSAVQCTHPAPPVGAAAAAVIGWLAEGQSRRLVGRSVVGTATDQWQCSMALQWGPAVCLFAVVGVTVLS
jgi:hypothetical protein